MSKIAEVYARAINTKNLGHHPVEKRAVDVLTAAGMCRNRLGTALMRLRAEWDGSAVPNFASYTDKNQYTTDMILLMGSLSSFREARDRCRDVAEMLGMGQVLADRVLWWWLDHICDACEGRGYQTIPGSPTLSDTACPACHGSGSVPVPGGRKGQELVEELDEYVKRAERTVGKKLGSLYFGNNGLDN